MINLTHFFKHQQITKTEFANYILTTICVSGLIGFAVGFTKHFNQPNGYYLPTFPNILDSIFIAFSAVYLGIMCIRGLNK